MPFDHAATFRLKGIAGNIIQDVINVSSDGIFVATGIGYGFEEDRARDIELTPKPSAAFVPGTITLSQIPASALIEGFRLNPRSERLLLEDSTSGSERKFTAATVHESHSSKIIQQLKPAEEISFLFSIVDSGTGRELQDEPIHNLASLGRSDGERPFRRLAQPLTFQPRSTLRMQIVERSNGVKGTLFIVLYGYKIVGGLPSSSPVPDSSRVIPFDYVAKFPLQGTPGNLLEDEVPINVEGGFIATSIGYGLSVERLNVQIDPNGLPATTPPADGFTNLGAIPLAKFPVSALIEGIRIRPNFLRIAFGGDGELNKNISIGVLDNLFERLNRPDDVSFRYSIFDTGTGRELQNQPIHNIAGLGIANGDRPFKQLAQPMRLLPRSTIRVNVEELFGRGTLFIVFQGYKILGVPTTRQVPVGTRRPRTR